jgi:hypothetical protein
MVCPLFHKYVYGEVPPVPFAVAVPLEEIHPVGVVVVLMEGGEVVVMLMVLVLVHPLVPVAVTE